MFDESQLDTILVYLVPAALIILVFWWTNKRASNRNRAILNSAREDGLIEPPSLHPVIDPSVCLGCATCVAACPEANKQPVLGIIDQRAVLIEPTNCIGHGACRTACPTGAIQLVFGTETRGVEIPHVSPEYETNVHNLFISGELGGMGLIKNAVQQGVGAVDAIRTCIKQSNDNIYDLVIVGAGPAGFAASLRAKELGMKSLTVEQDSLGGTVYQFPRGKLVMTAPVVLPLAGEVNFRETSKEQLLQFWTDIAKQHKPNIHFQERVGGITSENGRFTVVTDKREIMSQCVLLAIGRRGTPRKLGVDGEELPKVTYRLVDSRQYRHKSVLVVGGGDSALEAALSIADEPGSDVAISYRSEAFGRSKKKNREKIDAYINDGKLRIYFNSTIKKITADEVELNTNNGLKSIGNDTVIICAGGILPTKFLQSIGVKSETKYGTA